MRLMTLMKIMNSMRTNMKKMVNTKTIMKVMIMNPKKTTLRAMIMTMSTRMKTPITTLHHTTIMTMTTTSMAATQLMIMTVMIMETLETVVLLLLSTLHPQLLHQHLPAVFRVFQAPKVQLVH
jgi:predicted MPP superfamily phosphohydrolase